MTLPLIRNEEIISKTDLRRTIGEQKDITFLGKSATFTKPQLYIHIN